MTVSSNPLIIGTINTFVLFIVYNQCFLSLEHSAKLVCQQWTGLINRSFKSFYWIGNLRNAKSFYDITGASRETNKTEEEGVLEERTMRCWFQTFSCRDMFMKRKISGRPLLDIHEVLQLAVGSNPSMSILHLVKKCGVSKGTYTIYMTFVRISRSKTMSGRIVLIRPRENLKIKLLPHSPYNPNLGDYYLYRSKAHLLIEKKIHFKKSKQRFRNFSIAIQKRNCMGPSKWNLGYARVPQWFVFWLLIYGYIKVQNMLLFLLKTVISV